MNSPEFPDAPAGAQVNQQEWERFSSLLGRAHYRGAVRVFSRLPSAPRCEACGGPFDGIGGRLMRMTGKGPSRKNPRWCNVCFEKTPSGGFIATIGVLFVDVRGSTRLAEEIGPAAMASRLNEFYDSVTTVIVRHGLVDKLIGDEVMGVYLPPLSPGGRYVDAMVNDARDLMHALGYGTDSGPRLDVGVGLDVGPAFVGHVGTGELEDFTAIGDVVNTASRLQSAAEAGQIVMPESVARDAGLDDEIGTRSDLVLKGKRDPIVARVLSYG